MDVARAADVLLRGLGHECRRDAIQERDLLDPVLIDRVPVGGGDGVGVAHVELVLAVPRLPLGELDRDPGALHPAADRAEDVLVHRRGEDVVVEDVGDRRRQVAVVLLVRLGVALLVEVELELGGEHRDVAELVGALVLRDQHLPRRGDDRRAVVLDDVAQHQRAAVEPRDPAQRREVGRDPEVAVALLPVGHLVAGNRVHLHVEREQVVATLDAVVDDLVEEVGDLDPLADEPSLHVGEGGHDRVDRARLRLGPAPRATASRWRPPGPPGRVAPAIAYSEPPAIAGEGGGVSGGVPGVSNSASSIVRTGPL